MNLRRFNDIKGLTYNELSKLTDRDLRTVAQTVNDVYNKRMERLEESGVASKSQAYRYAEEAGKTRLHTKGKTNKELIDDINYAINKITNNKTSTVRGTKKAEKKMKELLGEMTEQEEQDFWENYGKIREELMQYNINSDIVMKQVRSVRDEEVIKKFEERFIHQHMNFYGDTETGEVIGRREALFRAKVEVVRNKALYGSIYTPEQLKYKEVTFGGDYLDD